MEIKAPIFPESIADGSVAHWHHQPGDFVTRDTLLVDIETDKVVIEVFAPEDGVLQNIFKAEGETVLSEEPIANFEPGGAATGDGVSAAAPVAADTPADGDRFASPAAKKLAAEASSVNQD